MDSTADVLELCGIHTAQRSNNGTIIIKIKVSYLGKVLKWITLYKSECASSNTRERERERENE
jgi:hypothetical protein